MRAHWQKTTETQLVPSSGHILSKGRGEKSRERSAFKTTAPLLWEKEEKELRRSFLMD